VKTLRFEVDAAHLTAPEAEAAIRQAAGILRAGGTVALPTETVYGLGANALDEAAVERIFFAKQRPAWDPVIVHISSLEMLENLVTEIPAAARMLMDAFWPGPLTLLLPRSTAVPDTVTAGRPLVGVRMPAHPVALELIRAAGVPVAAPSANIFGHTSPTTAAHVLADLDGRIDVILDSGPAVHGVESTVLDPCQSPMIVYRPGAVTAEQIRAVAGAVEVFQPAGPLLDAAPAPHTDSVRPAGVEALPSPGVGLRHYAPKAKLVLIEAPESADPANEKLAELLNEGALRFQGERLGVMLPAELPASALNAAGSNTQGQILFSWGRWSEPESLAQDLYAGLRWLDDQGCTVILCPLPPPEGIGAAIRDRLRKAAHNS
jgi:L-threonylcarbamoyladenylate synthase